MRATRADAVAQPGGPDRRRDGVDGWKRTGAHSAGGRNPSPTRSAVAKAARFIRADRHRGPRRRSKPCRRRGGGRRRRRRSRGRRRWRSGRSYRRRRRARPGRGRLRRQKQQRVDVAVRILGAPNTEVDVRDVMLDVSAWAARPDGGTLADRLTTPEGRRAEMSQRHRVAVGGLDRHGSATHGHGSDEGDVARSRRGYCRPRRCGDVDAPVLTGRVRIVSEHERLQQRASNRPGPGSCGRHDHECDHRYSNQGSTHLVLLVVLTANEKKDTCGVCSLSSQTTKSSRTDADAEGP